MHATLCEGPFLTPPQNRNEATKSIFFSRRVLRPGCLVATRKRGTSTYVFVEKKATKDGTSKCAPLKMAHFRPSRQKLRARNSKREWNMNFWFVTSP